MRTHVVLGVFLSLGSATTVSVAAKAQTPVAADVHTLFIARTSTEIPGQSLKPGSYSIHIVDHLKDRYILRVDDTRGNPVSTFIGLRNPDFNGSNSSGPVEWTNAPGKQAALRGFVFPKSLTVEFVYPKEEAVELAKLNESTVPAIDPQSEGRPLALKLSDADRQLVTLWMLTPTRVGDGNGTPAIAAERFHAAPDTELAEATPPRVPGTQTDAAPAQASTASPTNASVGLKDTPNKKPVVSKLPQTASSLPLVLLLSGILLAAGFVVGAGRKMASQAEAS